MLREHHVTYGQIIPYVKVGSVFEDVSSIIARSEADLIVMGTKGATGLYELLVGSNAEKVVRYARSPVIAVPRGDVGHFGLRNVVFATDFDDRAESLLLLLTGWQRVFRFKLHLLYVNTPGQYATTAKIEDRIGKFLKKYPGPQYTTAIVDEYSVRDGIRVYAAKVNADLVAMLTHGRDGLAHFLGGSLTEDAVNHLPTPVLTYNIHTHEQYCL
jgi:nucleotide-binding universal stress UspA family protein